MIIPPMIAPKTTFIVWCIIFFFSISSFCFSISLCLSFFFSSDICVKNLDSISSSGNGMGIDVLKRWLSIAETVRTIWWRRLSDDTQTEPALHGNNQIRDTEEKCDTWDYHIRICLHIVLILKFWWIMWTDFLKN